MNYLKKYWLFIIITFTFFIFYKPILCFLMLGLLALLLGLNIFYFLSIIKKNGIKTIGKILSYQSDREGYKTPTIEFTTLNGKQIKKEPYYYVATDLSKIKSYKNQNNKSISVIYDPNNPKRFILATESKFNYISLIFMIIIGLVFSIVSIFNLLGYIDINF